MGSPLRPEAPKIRPETTSRKSTIHFLQFWQEGKRVQNRFLTMADRRFPAKIDSNRKPNFINRDSGPISY